MKTEGDYLGRGRRSVREGRRRKERVVGGEFDRSTLYTGMKMSS
jgi:hypothetical protein